MYRRIAHANQMGYQMIFFLYCFIFNVFMVIMYMDITQDIAKLYKWKAIHVRVSRDAHLHASFLNFPQCYPLSGGHGAQPLSNSRKLSSVFKIMYLLASLVKKCD